MTKIKYSIIPITFVLFLIIPKLNSYLKFIKPLEIEDNRTLNEEPGFDIKHLDPFPAAYDAYSEDHFSLRSNFIGRYNHLKFVINNKSPKNHILLGKESFLFYNNNTVKYNTGEDVLSPEALESYRTVLKARTLKLQQENCKYYVAIIPSKASTYPQMLPSNLDTVGKNKQTVEVLVKYLHEHGLNNVFYLREPLRAASQNDRVYHKHDHHWNEKGACYASAAIQARLQKDFPEIETYSYNDYSFSSSLRRGGDLANAIGLSSFLLELSYTSKGKDGLPILYNQDPVGYPPPKDFLYTWGYEIRKRTDMKDLPKIMVINDSFGPYIVGFLGRSFSESLNIWDKWEYKLNDSIRQLEKPDIFLTLISEENLYKLSQE